jgi:hypothetical protein
MPLDIWHSWQAICPKYVLCLSYWCPIGCGKSELALYLQHTAKTEVVLPCCFRSSLARQSAQPAPLVVSLILQLLRNETISWHVGYERALGQIQQLLSSGTEVSEVPLKRLLNILDAFLQLLDSFTLIVDGLDECVYSTDAGLLFEFLLHAGSLPGARVIVLSRKGVRFDELFQGSFQLHMDYDCVRDDIKLFLEREISRNPTLQPFKAEIHRCASENSEGMFLWAKMFIDYLNGGRCDREVRRRLQCSPPELFSFYRKHLEENTAKRNAEDVTIRRQILLLLFQAVSPLEVGEVVTALAWDCGSNTIRKEDRLLNLVNNILELCHPFVIVVNEQVQLIHSTVKEFFE